MIAFGENLAAIVDCDQKVSNKRQILGSLVIENDLISTMEGQLAEIYDLLQVISCASAAFDPLAYILEFVTDLFLVLSTILVSDFS